MCEFLLKAICIMGILEHCGIENYSRKIWDNSKNLCEYCGFFLYDFPKRFFNLYSRTTTIKLTLKSLYCLIHFNA